jgi:hypothetical protein
LAALVFEDWNGPTSKDRPKRLMHIEAGESPKPRYRAPKLPSRRRFPPPWSDLIWINKRAFTICFHRHGR